MNKLKVTLKFILSLLICVNLLVNSLFIAEKISNTSKLIVLADYEEAEQNESEEENKEELETKAFESILYSSHPPKFTWSNYTVSISHRHKLLTSSYYVSIDIPPNS